GGGVFFYLPPPPTGRGGGGPSGGGDILTRYDASPDGQVEVYYDTAADMPLLLMGRVKPAEFEPGVGEGDWYACALEQIYGKRISIRRRSGA
ncbi:MAG: hypothetical protein K2M14_05530, partial [Muribaculaceae bacterium]|nr:hypothetical protein [Muribaculaceae bacterium]